VLMCGECLMEKKQKGKDFVTKPFNLF
jgi:hypothetical protein